MAQVPMVFVSSTRVDLKAERKAVLAVLQRLKLAHNSMEAFGAVVDRPLTKCLAEVKECDLFVIILGHRYGNTVPEDAVSFTEKEYRTALEFGKPVLAYIKDDNVPVLPAYVERHQDRNDKLKSLKDELCSDRTVSFFGSEVELAIQLAIDLKQFAQTRKRHLRRKERKPTATAEGAFDSPRSRIVTTSRRYGNAPPNLPGIVEGAGYMHMFIEPGQRIHEDVLRGTGILILPGSGYERELQLTDEEIKAITNFVASGGGLLCAGQAWSWAYSKYGNKPVEAFPLNALGHVLGFRISGKHIGEPDADSTDGEVFGMFKDWKHRNKWPPSELQAIANAVRPALNDHRGRAMALRGTYSRGRFVVVGHERMLECNPEALRGAVEFIRPKQQTTLATEQKNARA